MQILLSVKPKYAVAILEGTKTVEFRKTAIKRPVRQAQIYMSQTIKKVVASASIVSIIEDTPENLWDKFQNVGGISKKEFFDYFHGKNKGYALILDKVCPIPADKQETPEYIPQSFCYV